MPHVGKTIPRQFKNYLNIITGPLTPGPCRKLHLLQVGSSINGSVAELWEGADITSTVADYWPGDPRQTFYEFESPLDPLAKIVIRYELLEPFDPSGPFPTYRYWARAEATYDGDLMGRLEQEVSPSSAWQRALGRLVWGTAWDDDAGFPLWSSLRVDTQPANWAEQPEFHPYRHGP